MPLAPAVITCAWLGCIMLWEWGGADRWIMNQLAGSRGFPLRHDWWLSVVLHDGLRVICALAYLGIVAAIWKPFGFLRATSRLQRLETVIGVTAALLAVNVIKHFSLTSCPWDLAGFGGMAQYVSHWTWGLGDGGPGRCFPSGHASAGYAFFALAMPGLFAASPAVRRHGMRLFYAASLVGLTGGMAQVFRGAHYPSHVLWTGLACWIIAGMNHLAFKQAATLNRRC